MEVRLAPERELFVRRCVDGGQYGSPSDVIDAALRLLEAQGGGRHSRPKTVEAGLEQILRGKVGYVVVDDIKRRAFRREAAR